MKHPFNFSSFSAIKYLFCLLFFFVLLSAQTASGQNLSRRPGNINDQVFCNSCQAVVRQTLLKTEDKRTSSRISKVLKNLCEIQNLVIYEFPPPMMVEGCKAFLQEWSKETEKELSNLNGTYKAEDRVCFEVTKACFGVNLKVKNRFAPNSEDKKQKKIYFPDADL